MFGWDIGATGSLDALRALQLGRLRATLVHSYEGNPAYRAKFDAAGVHPSQLKTLDDLARFPFTTKADLRDNYPFGFFAVPRDQIVRLHASSGTTGKPVVVGYTTDDLTTWKGLVARSLFAAGVRPGMVVHNAYGYGLFTGGLGAHAGAEALGCTVVPISGGQTERQINLICDFRPDVLLSTPSYALVLADEFIRRGIDPAGTSLKTGVFGAEPWTDAMRAELEIAFGIDAVDIYGLSEVIGPGVASECVQRKDGATIWEDHFYPEIIDPETGAVLPDGARGELVFTSLTKQAMPIIRYRTRDLTRLLTGTTQPSFRRMERIAGRSDDMLIIRGVNVFPSQIEEQILCSPALAPHYVLEVARDGRLDMLTVHVERRVADGGDLADQARAIERNVKDTIGVSVQVQICAPGALPRSEGKAKRILDRRAES